MTIGDLQPRNNKDNQVVLFGELSRTNNRPLGIYTLAAFLRKHNIKTQTIWGWHQIPYDVFVEFCEKFLSENVKVVGISTTLLTNLQTSNSFFGCSDNDAITRLMLIKKLAPHAKIVIGGSQVMYSDLTKVPGQEFIDLFVKGQGEQVLLELAQSPESRIKTESITMPITSDKLYPFRDFSESVTVFDEVDCIMPNEGLTLEFARGCIFKCSFCNYDHGKNPGDYIKRKEVLIEELTHNYYKYGTTHYVVTDDLINDSEEKVDMILEVSRSLPFKLQYAGYLRLDLVRRFPNTAKKLMESGLFSCLFGIETIDGESGKKVGKGLGLERINEAIDICNDAWNGKMIGHGSFILGLPNHDATTKDDLWSWLNTDRVKKLIKRITVHPLYITPKYGHSEIDQNPEKFGYLFDEYNDSLGERHKGTNINWKTVDYNFIQATADSQELTTKFESSKKYGSILGTFRLPYMLALSDKKQEILDLILTDESSVWPTFRDWKHYHDNLEMGYRKKYIELMRNL